MLHGKSRMCEKVVSICRSSNFRLRNVLCSKFCCCSGNIFYFPRYFFYLLPPIIISAIELYWAYAVQLKWIKYMHVRVRICVYICYMIDEMCNRQNKWKRSTGTICSLIGEKFQSQLMGSKSSSHYISYEEKKNRTHRCWCWAQKQPLPHKTCDLFRAMWRKKRGKAASEKNMTANMKSKSVNWFAVISAMHTWTNLKSGSS